MKTLIFLAFSFAAFAQPADPKPPPKITLEQQAQWLQARAEVAESRLAVKTAEDRFNQIVKEIMAVCLAIVSPAGRPECPPPKPTEAPAK